MFEENLESTNPYETQGLGIVEIKYDNVPDESLVAQEEWTGITEAPVEIVSTDTALFLDFSRGAGNSVAPQEVFEDTDEAYDGVEFKSADPVDAGIPKDQAVLVDPAVEILKTKMEMDSYVDPFVETMQDQLAQQFSYAHEQLVDAADEAATAREEAAAASGYASAASQAAADAHNTAVTAQEAADQAKADALDAFNKAAAAGTLAEAAVQGYTNEYAVSTSETEAPTTGWSTTAPARTPGSFIWFRTKVSKGDGSNTTTSPVVLTGNSGAKGDAAPTIALTGSTSTLVSAATGGSTAPATATITAVATGTSITTWTYAIDGAGFGGGAPAGVVRTGDTVVVTGGNMTARTVAIKASNADGSASDTFTVARVFNGAQGTQGNAGADAYTVLLSNEAHTFPGDTNNALASSTTSTVIAYKGGTQVAATVGTITGQVTGLTTSIAGNGTNAPVITLIATTALTTKSGVLNVPVTVDGKAFTVLLSWSVAFSGISVQQVTPFYAQVPAGAAAPALPTTQTPAAPWVINEPAYQANTDMYRVERVLYNGGTPNFSYTNVVKVSSYDAAKSALQVASKKSTVFIQTAAPAAEFQTADTLWIDTTGGNNIPKQWNGSAWVAVQDKSIQAAADAAANAKSQADKALKISQAAQGMGTELILNGSGQMGDNTNFPTAMFDTYQPPSTASASFRVSGASVVLRNDILFPIERAGTYYFSAEVRAPAAKVSVVLHMQDATGAEVDTYEVVPYATIGASWTSISGTVPGDVPPLPTRTGWLEIFFWEGTQYSITNISLRNITGKTDFARALAAANGKNTRFVSTLPASGSQGPQGETPTEGDTWWQWDNTSSRNVIGQWVWSSNSWKAEKITDQVIANLDVNKLTVSGSARMAQAVVDKIIGDAAFFKSITVDKLAVTSSNSIYPDPTFQDPALNAKRQQNSSGWQFTIGQLTLIGANASLNLTKEAGVEFNSVILNMGSTYAVRFSMRSPVDWPADMSVWYYNGSNGVSTQLPTPVYKNGWYETTFKAAGLLGMFTLKRTNNSQTIFTGIEIREAIGGVLIENGGVTADAIATKALDFQNAYGMQLTAPVIKTAPSGARVEITSAGLKAYNASGIVTSLIEGASGSFVGSSFTGSTITGGTIIGAQIWTDAASARGIKISQSGMNAYNSSGQPTFQLDANTGMLEISGNLSTGVDTQYPRIDINKKLWSNGFDGIRFVYNSGNTHPEIKYNYQTFGSFPPGSLFLNSAGPASGATELALGPTLSTWRQYNSSGTNSWIDLTPAQVILNGSSTVKLAASTDRIYTTGPLTDLQTDATRIRGSVGFNSAVVFDAAATPTSQWDAFQALFTDTGGRLYQAAKTPERVAYGAATFANGTSWTAGGLQTITVPLSRTMSASANYVSANLSNFPGGSAYLVPRVASWTTSSVTVQVANTSSAAVTPSSALGIRVGAFL